MMPISLYISAIVAIIGIWSEVFEGPRRLRNQHKARKRIIRIVATLFAIVTLIVGFADYENDQEELKSAHIAYQTLDSTYQEALRTGIAVNSISYASKKLQDSLDSASQRLSYFSKAQLRNLGTLHNGTEAILNPLPDHIIVGWSVSFYLSTDDANALDSLLKGRPNAGPRSYKLNDTLLSRFTGPSSFHDITFLKFEMIAKDKSVTYGGDLGNYDYLPLNADSQDLNDATIPFTNILYISSNHSIEFSGMQRLRLEDISGNVKSLLDFSTCNLLFSSGLILDQKKYIEIGAVSIFAGLRNSNKFGSHREWNYDPKQDGFVLKEQNILAQRSNPYH